MKWAEAPLGKVVRFIGGGTPSKARSDFWQGSIPWVSPKDMLVRDILDSQDHISESAVLASATQIVPIGSVLIVVRSGILAHTLPIGITRVPLTVNQDLKALSPTIDCLSNEYLAYFLQARSSRVLSLCVKRGPTVHSLDIDKLRQIPIPLPTFHEQRRIVEILDQAYALLKKRPEADVEANRILPALFYQMFGNLQRNPKGWPTVPMEDVVFVEWGNTSITKDSYSDTGYPAFSATGQDGFLPHAEHEGDGIVVSAIGARCGKCFYATGKWTAIKNTLTITRPAVDLLNLKYLFHIVNDENFWPKRGGGQPFIALGTARTCKFPLPPLSLQNMFGDDLSAVWEIKVKQAETYRLVEQLFQSLLHRAFTGYLTSQWREGHMKELLLEMEQQAKVLSETC